MASLIFRSERGAAMIALLTLLPLVLAITLAATATFMVMRTNSAATHLCRTTLLEIQTERLAAIDDLIALNTEAKILRASRWTADKAYKSALATGTPPTIAAARAAVLAVQVLQLAFKINRDAIRGLGYLKTRQGVSRLEQGIRRLHSNDSTLYRSQDGDVVSNFRSEYKSLGVEPKQKRELTPDFVRVKNFEKHEYLQLRWKLHVLRLLPKWLRLETVSDLKIEVGVSCAASIEKKGAKKWRARLAADKRFLSLW